MTARTYARVDLVVEGEWRVGTWRTEDEPQGEDRAVIAIAALGEEPYLPGSGIGGALRAHLSDVLGRPRTAEIFGPEPPESGEEELYTSQWWVLAARLPAGSWERRERKQTAISRHRRAPAKGSLRTGQSVAAVGAETHVRIYLRCDAAARSPAAQDLLQALATWQPRIGGGKTVGLGRAQVTAVRYRDVVLNTREGLLARLAGNDPDSLDNLLEHADAGDVAPAAAAPTVLLSCDFDLPHGLAAPDDTTTPGRHVMDGSTWKGVIRSRVEYVARSVGMAVCGDDRDGPVRACGTCQVCRAFGSPESAGILDFSSTPVARSAGTIRQVRQRVALNRFTGGARDELLYRQGTEGRTAFMPIATIENYLKVSVLRP